jgi:metal-sulfur cluster biosynthetic enzyme
MITKKQVEAVLDTVPDPEIGISIVQLGLVYTVEVENNNVRIVMTLTSIGCPLFDQIQAPIREGLAKLDGLGKVDIDLTFEPAWSPDKMSDEAKMQLGFL